MRGRDVAFVVSLHSPPLLRVIWATSVVCVYGAVAAICAFCRIVGLVRGDGELGTSSTSVYAPPECVVYLYGAGRVLLLRVCVCVCQ